MVMLFDCYNLPEDMFEIVFATEQQQIVGRALVEFLLDHNNEVSKTEMSMFATDLHEGTFTTIIDRPGYKGRKVKLSYNKRQFYDRILTPMKSMGMINFDLYKKTYKLSDKFNKELIRIGLLWLKEIGQVRRVK